MRRRPGDVVDIVTVVLERVERLVFFQTPEFDGPVKGGREEQMGEIYSTLHRVCANASDWPLMTFVRFCQPGAAAMSTSFSNIRQSY